MGRGDLIAWLMEGDPAIRWQVLRDLLGAPVTEWRAEQARVAAEGWGARLLTHQDDDGRWTARLYGKKWISTTYSMVLLRRMGLAPHERRAGKACNLLLDEGLRPDGGIGLSVTTGRSETCLTSMVLGDRRLCDAIAALESRRRPDGRWPLQQRHPGQTWFEMEEVGGPSRWNTLRALRVLDWWRASPVATREPAATASTTGPQARATSTLAMTQKCSGACSERT